ncbi:MAG: ABC transporter permease, partial [Planctomycetota bacterium]
MTRRQGLQIDEVHTGGVIGTVEPDTCDAIEKCPVLDHHRLACRLFGHVSGKTTKRLFPFENPIGRTIWVGSEFYTVIGQTRDRTASAAIGGSLDARDYNLDAYIPIKTLRQRVGDLVMKRVGGGQGWNFVGEDVELSQITVECADIEDVDETAQIIETILK